jgi:mono/diheme cytochrome c family protein
MLHRGSHPSIIICVLGFMFASTSVSAAQASMTAPALINTEEVAKGEYIAHAAGCVVCHTDRKHKGKPFAGGRALHTPFGTFYAPNITPDKDTGIGNWSEQQFLNALRKGVQPNGDNLYPVFPYTAYTKLSNDDSRALWAYLRSLTPVQQPNKAHDLKWYAPPRPIVWFWKLLYFTPGRYKPDPQHSDSWNRGAYLATAAAHCGECHTPRNILGGKKTNLRYAGADNKEEDFFAPNITPAPKTGIGDWTIQDLVTYFQLGLDPDGDTAGNVMAEFIDNGLSHLRKADLQAIAAYITSLPAIEHSIGKKQEQPPHQKPEWE